MRGRKPSWAAVGVLPAVVVIGSAVWAATLDVHAAKDKTRHFTQRNATALLGVSSAVPDNLRIEVVEIVQALAVSRDRILLFLDRVGEGVFPPEEGVRRATGIAEAAAQREKTFLEGLKARVPAPVVPKVEQALAVSNESWQGVLSAFQLSAKKEESRDLPSRPALDFRLGPGPTIFPPPDE
jgi:hypothetical protein